ncbi:NADH:ubiquinone oxidoreductase subunit NDUFA12 [soil metagenome]
MGLLAQIFTWWNGQTLGTRLHTWRRGRAVGEDAAGNRFYQNADGSRRWVIFKGAAEASAVPPEWHGWLHHTWQEPPSKVLLAHRAWERPHVPNATGGEGAFRPPGSLLLPNPAPVRDYEPWTPG